MVMPANATGFELGRLATLYPRRKYEMEVAHQLTAGVPERHKCRRLHGHRYELTLWISGDLDADGIVIEYDALDRVVMPVIRLVDHHCLNDLSDRCSTPSAAAVAANPTVERLAAWFGARLAGIVASAVNGRRLHLQRLRVQEDSLSGAEWAA